MKKRLTDLRKKGVVSCMSVLGAAASLWPHMLPSHGTDAAHD
jgi:hypothetical protein